MVFLMWAAPEACGNAFAHLLSTTAERPEMGFLCAAALENPAQSDRVLKQAYLAAMLLPDKTVVARHIQAVLDRPWLGEVNFFDAVQAAAAMGAAESQALLSAAAARNPSLAVREVAEYRHLPGGPAAFVRAARLAPNEAVMLARGQSPTAAAVRSALAAIPYLAKLAAAEGLGDVERQRQAVFHLAPQRAAAATDAAYLTRLVELRLAAQGDPAILYDRALAGFSQMLFVEARSSRAALARLEPAKLPAAAGYLLLAYGRTESDDPAFATIFDGLLAPKLRAGGMTALLNQTKGIQLRNFLVSAITHGRFETLLGYDPQLLDRAVSGISNTEDAVAAAEVIDASGGAARLRALERALVREHDAASERMRPLYGLLAARARQRGADSPDLAALAARYEKFLRAPFELDTGALFEKSKLVVERHFFYDDDDGVASFANFRQTFARDPAWKWEDRGGWVEVTGQSESGRRIVMVANEPIDLFAAGNGGRQGDSAARQSAVTRHLAERSMAPAVIVHRGHAYHAGKTIGHLNGSVRLIFLGSCRGTAEVDAALSAASGAQVIATRGIGTQDINDPLLKALNTELLKDARKLDWQEFWTAQTRRLGSSSLFHDYIPPHRNSAAVLLAAYHSYLAGLW